MVLGEDPPPGTRERDGGEADGNRDRPTPEVSGCSTIGTVGILPRKGAPMASSSMQKLKVLHLMDILRTETDPEHGLTMPQLIERLAARGIDAERKGIYRDIETLREFGMDIRQLKRQPVQYALAERDFELSQLTLLVDAVQSSRFLTQRTAARLVKKLSALASVHEREALKGRVHVDGRVKSQSDSVFYNVDTIHEAMRQKRKVAFLYYKYDSSMKPQAQHDGKLYVETPVHVVFANGYYYLIGWSDNHEDFVRFRVDRMRLLQVTDEKAARNQAIANYAFEDFAYQAFGMFGGDPVRARLRVAPDAMDIVADRFGTDLPVKPRKDGGAEVSVTVRKSAQFFGWVAGMNGAVTIAGPKKLVDEYRSWLQGLASRA